MIGCMFREDTLDDLMSRVLGALLNADSHVEASRGRATEIFGATLILNNPRARLSRSESKGKLFSALGELLWYLSGDIKFEFIRYYVGKAYDDETEDQETVRSGYGRRLFRHGETNIDQIANVIELLKQKPSSRRAVIQIFDASDIDGAYKSVPCTCTLQFVNRDGKLNMLVNMRSNDAFLGLPHDVFAFTMLQEIIARSIGAELGIYQHCVGSLHLYDDHREKAITYLGEGYFNKVSMDPMPDGDPWRDIKNVVEFERIIRTKEVPVLEELPRYWADLCTLLQIFRAWRDSNFEECTRLRSLISSPVYRVFIEDKLTH